MYSTTLKGDKLITLFHLMGYKSIDTFFSDIENSRVHWGICMKRGCNHVQTVQPTDRAAFCANCDDDSVCSAHVLIGAVQ